MSLSSFTYASDIDIKVKKVAVDNVCPVCEQIFKNKEGVLKHRQHHSNPTCHLSLLPYKCIRCPMVFANCKNLFHHKAYHTEVWLAPPKEKDDDFRFESKPNFMSYLNIQTMDKNVSSNPSNMIEEEQNISDKEN